MVVLQRADEGESAGDIIVGDDQRSVQFVVHIVIDLAQVLADGLVGPAFKGASQIDADNLA